MKKHVISLWGFLSVALLSVAFSAAAATPNMAEPTVVMMSLDGFRWDYIEKYHATNLAAIAANGVRAEQLRPAYPTKTFPNHLTLITGLYPVHHGIVDNRFCDKERQQCYKMGMGKEDSTWLSGIPLWNLAEINGVKAATYFWPESDARINGMTPSYYYHYSQKSDYQARIDQIIDWLKLPPAARPHFIAGYFSLVDTMGHDFGPDSGQVAQAVAKVDTLIGRLRAGIKQLDYPVNLIVLADHGMTAIDNQKAFDYRQLSIDEQKFQVVNASTRLLLYAKPAVTQPDISALRQQLKQVANGHYRVLTEDYLQARHYTDSPRVADIILEVDAPSYFTAKPLAERHGGGNHGYSYIKDMGALFVAEGPAFKQGVMLPAFDNVSVYPLVAHILGLPITHPVDGTITPLLPALNQ
ncbi:ectonucleotide pyrophosphatase/phosphodiesterase [Shewanella sp. A32]|uniref:alkaline phosphatase family protein n=1 Tax=Shewanella sp. A32 TaxID=3031327 RepID=UPI0023B9B84A|nr:ectonucleotide pyrophosphatase/phosphodiesterase [Shewanella sp. A32]MDF0534100.1 ectonucleotide pyrophosphatase/phosphodiesterase [Shewanella sp. A32]